MADKTKKLKDELNLKKQKWEVMINFYFEKLDNCIVALTSIDEIKNKLTTLIGKQRNDDIIFYKSIINSSYYYYSESLKVRKLKFIKDLSYIWNKLDEKKELDELTKYNVNLILKDFCELYEEIIITKQYNTSLLWVKNEKVITLQEFEDELSTILKYHVNIISSFETSIINEAKFFCPRNN